MGTRSSRLKVYYDGACPRCRRDRRRYERLAGTRADEVEWIDITGKDETLQRIGIDPDAALRELHVQDAKGQIHRELDAYILLMSRVPLLMPLAWVLNVPVIRPLLSRLYRWSVRRRLKRQGRS